MNIIYYRRNRLTAAQEDSFGVSYTSLDDVFELSDVVGLAIPATIETRGLINERLIRLMKPSATLINVARGGVIDQQALYRALAENRLAGAGIDAFDPEPTSAELLPLLRHPNVIASPHIAARSLDEMVHSTEVSAANILRVSRGEAPLHRLEVGAFSGYVR